MFVILARSSRRKSKDEINCDCMEGHRRRQNRLQGALGLVTGNGVVATNGAMCNIISKKLGALVERDAS
jgi:hypothetical protein